MYFQDPTLKLEYVTFVIVPNLMFQKEPLTSNSKISMVNSPILEYFIKTRITKTLAEYNVRNRNFGNFKDSPKKLLLKLNYLFRFS
jgi:hypothetical protein